MTRMAPSGTFSCAGFSLQGFGTADYTANEKYLSDPDNYKDEPIRYKCGDEGHDSGDEIVSASDFYSDVLMPLSQPMGRSRSRPFDLIMKEVMGHEGMRSKVVLVTLNQSYFVYKDNYWPRRLKQYDFELITATNNSSGEICYYFIRRGDRNYGMEGANNVYSGL